MEQAKKLYDEGVALYKKKEFVRAAQALEQSAQLDNPDAQNYLGTMYENGEGVKQSFVEAVNYYKLAAAQDHKYGQTNLGRCFEEGYGIAQNLDMAALWYQRAARQGHESAQKKLEAIYKKYSLVPTRCYECDDLLNNDLRVRPNPHSALCSACFKKRLDNNIALADKASKENKKLLLLVMIGTIVGLTLGLILFFAIPKGGFDPFRVPLLIYLILGGGYLLIFLFSVFSSFDHLDEYEFEGIMTLFYFVLILLSIVGAPIVGAYRYISIAVNFGYIKSIKKVNNDMKSLVDTIEPSSPYALEQHPLFMSYLRCNALLEKLDK